MPRLFIALPIPDDVRKRLKSSIQTIPGRSVPSPNWHLTLMFFGNVSDEMHEGIQKALDVFTFQKSFLLSLNELDAFPHKNRARVLWIGVDKGKQELYRVATELRSHFREKNIAFDPKPFVPHITISRFKKPQDIEAYSEKVGSLGSATLAVNKICLFKSSFINGSVAYEIVQEVGLTC
ncbi:MAG: RNA 2',3'-cyclic phosphodiesterase [Alphaproteobacteria bacterium]|jgi:RNA 2',3'-cyclic 3'-phosphodiesterase|nr:RNA 2',3'-cyclic phosphodiesterase [Alphaproteobacteria bacterium]MBT5390092.1 RNA 2',3'-cyclic phosphodiesterase [Alphaproteobacteria bacterium]MBT5540935.1 RNA 2',3'-cyclic phosphodiesterase [Alphaproteobacteria bacterium]